MTEPRPTHKPLRYALEMECGNCGAGKHWKGFCFPKTVFTAMALYAVLMISFIFILAQAFFN